MSLQAIQEHEPPIRYALPITETVAGFDGARLVVATTGSLGRVAEDFAWYSNAMIGIAVGGTYYASSRDYDPDFVASILQADAAVPEASFNNVVDMLEWLNRE
jgi:hypothetical protein